MKIVVTGSLGNIGKQLTAQLVKNGHEVIGIGHRPENKQDIEAIGATAAIGSVDDKDFLTQMLTGADAAFTMVPPNYTVPDSREYYNKIGDSFAYAIQQSGIKRIVNLSSWGAHLPQGTGFITGSHDIEVKFNELSNANITHLRSGYIYYNLYHFIDMIKNKGIIGSNYGGGNKIVLTAPSDIADAALEELERVSPIGKNNRYIASDDRSTDDIAQALGNAIGLPDLKWITFTDNEVKNAMEQQGVPKDVIKNSVELNASIHNGKMREDYDLHKSVATGKVKLENFAKEFASRF